MDNHFSGDDVLHYLGEGGWAGTMTCRCNRLPKSVPRKYFNFIKAAPVNARSKVAQFEHPIIAVKYVEHQDSDRVTDKKDYVLCHVSFRSTGGTNIFTVNALSLVDVYVRDCSKGRGQQRRTWGIEMNEAQETYLKNYSAVDKIDQMLLGWDVTYRSWRWWHAPTRHAKAIAMSMAYSLYIHCAKATVDSEWKVTPVSGPRFWHWMSLQMVQYKSSNLQYPGDEKMHKNTQLNKKKHGTSNIGLIKCNNHIKRVSYLLYLDEKESRGVKKTRLCACYMMLLKQHLNSMKRVHLATCQICGKKTYMECQICKKHVCFKVERLCLVCPGVALISMMIYCMV
jgi:hypothetical protein